ncbi:hypothetical protein MY10362_005653 [Beauveria mimosiformis]
MVQIVGKEVATTVDDLTPAGLGFARDRLTLGDILDTEMAAYDRGYRLWSGAQ